MSNFMTEKEASERYGIDIAWFQRIRWRKLDILPFHKLGTRLLYKISECDKWFNDYRSAINMSSIGPGWGKFPYEENK